MSLQKHEICLLSKNFILFAANNVLKTFCLAKNVDLFSSVFKKIIPDATTPTFQEVGGVTQPLIFVEGNQFLMSIKGRNSVPICQNLPICNPRTLLPNINSHTKFEVNR